MLGKAHGNQTSASDTRRGGRDASLGQDSPPIMWLIYLHGDKPMRSARGDHHVTVDVLTMTFFGLIPKTGPLMALDRALVTSV